MLTGIVIVAIVVMVFVAVVSNYLDWLPHSRRCWREDCDRARCLDRRRAQTEAMMTQSVRR